MDLTPARVHSNSLIQGVTLHQPQALWLLWVKLWTTYTTGEQNVKK